MLSTYGIADVIPGRSWMTIRAGRITSEGTDGATIAVSIEPSAHAERIRLFGRVVGLTDRESEVLDVVVASSRCTHAGVDPNGPT